MDMHGMLQRRKRRLRCHRIRDAMYGLVAAGAENRGAENLPGVGLHAHLHEPLRLPLFDGTVHPGHRAISHTDLTPAGARFLLCHADAPQRRIDEQAITENTVGYPTVFAVEQIAGHDLEIVVGRVSESASAVTVA